MALPAIHEALAQAGRRPDEVDCVIVGCSNLQRAYPAVAIEIQHALGAGGLGVRHERGLLVGHVLACRPVSTRCCNGSADCVVVVHPEITSGHNNFAAARPPLHLRRRLHRGGARACRRRRRQQSSGRCSRGRLVDQVLQQHPQRLRLPQPQRGRRARPVRAGVPPARAAGVQGGRARWWSATSTSSCDALSLEAVRHPPLLAAPGEPEDEPADRQGRARPAARRGRGAGHPRPATRTRRRPARSSPSTCAAPTWQSGDIGVLCSFGAGYSIGSLVIRKV